MNATATKRNGSKPSKDKKEEKHPTYEQWLAQSPTNGFVYFIASDKRLKIGSARDPRQRIRELQTGCPHKMEIFGLIPSGCAQALEQVLHYSFREYRMPDSREWYDIRYDELVAEVNNIEKWTRALVANLRNMLGE